MTLTEALSNIQASLAMNSIQLDSVITSSHGTADSAASSSNFFSDKYEKSTELDLTSLDSKVNRIEENILICIFLSVIVCGFIGNILVIFTVLANKHMRTTSNLFILNLAISDLTLCAFSIPFMTYKTLRHTWIFGQFLCRLAPFFQATNVLVSTMSITAIALDRYVNIVCAMKIRQTNLFLRSYGGVILCISIWFFSFLLSSPLFVVNSIETEPILFNLDSAVVINQDHILFTTNSSSSSSPDSNNYLYKNDSYGYRSNRKRRSAGQTQSDSSSSQFNSINLNAVSFNSNSTAYQANVVNNQKMVEEEFNIDDMSPININHCAENWSSQYRLAYSYSLLLIQYIFPILIVGLAYGSIWWKLKKHRNKLRKHQQGNRSQMVKKKPAKAEEEPLNTANQETAIVSQANNNLQVNNEVIVTLPSGVMENASTSDLPKNPTASKIPSASPRLNKHAVAAAAPSNTGGNQNDNKRQRKMNILLAFIAIIFAGSWLPLNIMNILSDTNLDFIKASHTFYIVNAICILFAMSSAVSNPFLYGFLNENFKREYIKLFNRLHEKCKCIGKKQLPPATGGQSYVNSKMIGMKMSTKVTSGCANNFEKV